jgi:TetR/AcrR family transcriptional repressor of mexJK operon
MNHGQGYLDVIVTTRCSVTKPYRTMNQSASSRRYPEGIFMAADEVESRSDRKRRLIMEAATRSFLDKGYDGTSMDEIATLAEVSKPTVYKYFADKERLFAEIVRATTDQVDGLMHVVADALTGDSDVERDLVSLARSLITILMQPQTLRLRRLVIANADRFPDVGRTWYERGFGRVLGTLATSFQGLAERGQLRLSDPLLAAHHFVGLLLWIPVNQAMFSGSQHSSSKAELERYAGTAVHAFLAGYGLADVPAGARHGKGKRSAGAARGR